LLTTSALADESRVNLPVAGASIVLGDWRVVDGSSLVDPTTGYHLRVQRKSGSCDLDSPRRDSLAADVPGWGDAATIVTTDRTTVLVCRGAGGDHLVVELEGPPGVSADIAVRHATDALVALRLEEIPISPVSQAPRSSSSSSSSFSPWFNEASVWGGTLDLDVRNSLGGRFRVAGVTMHVAGVLDLGGRLADGFGLELGIDKEVASMISVGATLTPSWTQAGPELATGVRLTFANTFFLGVDGTYTKQYGTGVQVGAGFHGVGGAIATAIEAAVVAGLLVIFITNPPMFYFG
jgi:hypothetical protein